MTRAFEAADATTWPDVVMCLILTIGTCVVIYIGVKHIEW